MAINALPQPRTRKRGPVRVAAFFAALGSAIAVFASDMIAPHRTVLSNLRQIPLTVAGFACIDFAAFHLPHGWGWLVTGLSFILLEHLIADEGDKP